MIPVGVIVRETVLRTARVGACIAGTGRGIGHVLGQHRGGGLDGAGNVLVGDGRVGRHGDWLADTMDMEDVLYSRDRTGSDVDSSRDFNVAFMTLYPPRVPDGPGRSSVEVGRNR